MAIEEILGALGARLRNGRMVLVGLGNILRGDDGFGPSLVEALAHPRNGLKAIDAGTVPENHVGTIRRMEPDTVILADAAELGREAGAAELLDRTQVAEGACLFSTHTMSPALVMELIETETGAEVLLLAVQPLSTGFGEELSEPVLRTLGKFVEVLGAPEDPEGV